MAINLMVGNSNKIDEAYTHESYIANKANGKYKFTGTKGIKIYSPVTVPLTPYDRDNGYGKPERMQNEVQELIVTQDEKFSLLIDKGDAESAGGTFAAGARMKQQLREQVVPKQDMYAIKQYIKQAGHVVGIDAPTKSNILEKFSDAGTAMDNELVPTDGRYLFIGASLYGRMRLANEVVHLEGTGNKALKKGVLGEIMGFQIVKVPDRYIPDGAYFLAFRSESVVNPHKIHDAKLHEDPIGYSGNVLEGRFLYDAFVLDKKSGGVYAAVDSGSKQATPTIEVSGGIATITSSGATSIKCTVDGSDPRYSEKAITIQSGGTCTCESGDVIRAVAYGTFTSDVAKKEV